MKKVTLFTVIFLLVNFLSFCQETASLTLLDLQSQEKFRMGSQFAEKGLVLIFHSIKCPFVTTYESRIKALEKTYKQQGFNFILVNPDIGNTVEELINIKVYLDKTRIKIPYLLDEHQEWTRYFGITKIPEVLLLTQNKGKIEIAFRGAIDNNPQVETRVSEKYLVQAIEQVLNSKKPTPSHVRPIGCNIRVF